MVTKVGVGVQDRLDTLAGKEGLIGRVGGVGAVGALGVSPDDGEDGVPPPDDAPPPDGVVGADAGFGLPPVKRSQPRLMVRVGSVGVGVVVRAGGGVTGGVYV